MSHGTVISIRGVVIDIQFPEDKTPKVYDALTIEDKNLGTVTLEVQSVLGAGLVRTVAMTDVYGMKRGVKVSNTNHPIEVPVGEETLGIAGHTAFAGVGGWALGKLGNVITKTLPYLQS